MAALQIYDDNWNFQIRNGLGCLLLIISEIQIMALLTDLGPMLTYEQIATMQKILKEVAMRQFLSILKKYHKWQKTTDPSLIKWGEEIEGHFLKLNENKQLELGIQMQMDQLEGVDFPLVLEYGRWMFEMTPVEPYETDYNCQEIINDIRNKYRVLHSKDVIALTIPTIPFLGVRNQSQKGPFINEITQSIYVDDSHISDHPRFRTLTRNIRARRGSKVDIRVPIFMDTKTSLEELALSEPYPGFIYLDAMAFGMGMACLQCTFSTQNLDHARYLYDQMNIVSPLMLAVTAGTPIHKGKLADWDARWNILSDSVDCRTEDERNKESKDYVHSSRYSAADLFIWNGESSSPAYNDINLCIKEEHQKFLAEHAKEYGVEMDQYLIDHISNLIKRDMLIGYQKLQTMNEDCFTMFEIVNGTNWNSVRLKIPIDDQIGWRVEFRTMEVQPTPDQNSAFSLLIHFFIRALHLDTKVNLYIPMSLVKENFQRAHANDAVRKQKFFFRTNIFDQGKPNIQQLTLHQIFFGAGTFVGLFEYVRQRLLSQSPESKVRSPRFLQTLEEVGEFLRDITSGKRLTLAQWMRRYVDQHPLYGHNSILPKQVMDDMILRLDQISKGSFLDQNFRPIFKQ